VRRNAESAYRRAANIQWVGHGCRGPRVNLCAAKWPPDGRDSPRSEKGGILRPRKMGIRVVRETL
jgi:hypothetical protein